MIRQKAQTYQMKTGANNDLHATKRNFCNELANKRADRCFGALVEFYCN